MNRLRIPEIRAGLYLLLALCTPAGAADEPRTLVVQPGDNLRTLAAEHLGDAELWPEWLRANDLNSAAQVRAGMPLRFPEPAVLSAQQALSRASALIEQANRLSARIFAAEAIGNAVHLHNQALEARQGSRWKQVLSLAEEASQQAQSAVDQCVAQQHVAAEAQLADRGGDVQRRVSGDVVWKAAPVQTPLMEGDRLRTLENAFAVLLFRDQSRLRMDENSQLLIKQMRSNLLERREQAKVSLISGDLFALLGGNQARNAFDVEVPGVALAGNSRDFYVRRDDQGSKVANYQGELELASDKERLVLEENEGIAVSDSGFSDKRALLPAPERLQPDDGEIFYTLPLQLSWAPVEDTAEYWVEIADGPGFAKVQARETVTGEPRLQLDDLPEGAWFWRVLAVDDAGFPGPRSDARSFTLIHDREPPLLALRQPAHDLQLRETPLPIRGIAEPGARVTLNGVEVPLQEGGDFALAQPLEAGENRLHFRAVDAAGNVAELVRSVDYRPEPDLFLDPAENLPGSLEAGFFVRGTTFTLRGRTLPGTVAGISAESGAQTAAATADEDGRFSLNLPVPAAQTRLRLRLRSRSGQMLEQPLTLIRISEAPRLTLDPEPTRYAQGADLALRGRAEGATLLRVNGEPVALADGAFEQALTLAPGANRIRIEACNPAGQCSLLRRTLLFDRQAPELLEQILEVRDTAAGPTAYIRVSAEDDLELARAAEYEMKVGDTLLKGWLRLSAAGRYTGTQALPPGIAPPNGLKRLVLRDQAGHVLDWQAPIP